MVNLGVLSASPCESVVGFIRFEDPLGSPDWLLRPRYS